jgi:hypothetical protein
MYRGITLTCGFFVYLLNIDPYPALKITVNNPGVVTMTLNSTNQFSTTEIEFRVTNSKLDKVFSGWFIAFGFLTVIVALYFGMTGLVNLLFNPKIKEEEDTNEPSLVTNHRKSRLKTEESRINSLRSTSKLNQNKVGENSSPMISLGSGSFNVSKNDNSPKWADNKSELNKTPLFANEDDVFKTSINCSAIDEGSMVSVIMFIYSS